MEGGFILGVKKGRKVKLQDTGEWGNSLIDYKAEDGKYYSSKEAYDKRVRHNINHFAIIDKMKEFMGYDKYQQLNTSFYKTLSEWEKGYDTEVILRAMKCIEDTIAWANENKSFNSEYNKLAYFSSVIRNRLNDAKKSDEYERKNAVIVEVAEDVDLSYMQNNNIAIKDISAFLEEDDD